MATNSVENILAGAHNTLAKANKFTESVEGNPTSTFAPPKPKAPHVPQAHEHSDAPYALARDLRAKQENVEQYTAANPK